MFEVPEWYLLQLDEDSMLNRIAHTTIVKFTKTQNLCIKIAFLCPQGLTHLGAIYVFEPT
jgi:hypothetical protein